MEKEIEGLSQSIAEKLPPMMVSGYCYRMYDAHVNKAHISLDGKLSSHLIVYNSCNFAVHKTCTKQ